MEKNLLFWFFGAVNLSNLTVQLFYNFCLSDDSLKGKKFIKIRMENSKEKSLIFLHRDICQSQVSPVGSAISRCKAAKSL